MIASNLKNNFIQYILGTVIVSQHIAMYKTAAMYKMKHSIKCTVHLYYAVPKLYSVFDNVVNFGDVVADFFSGQTFYGIREV